MAKGFKHGAGGGASLNFKIIGNPQPETAKDNTIWVDTDAEITSWVFSATQPSDPVEGMVWITTDTSSTVEFNALKKNGIQVCPLSAKQYVNGAWIFKDASICQNDQWSTFRYYLFKSGNGAMVSLKTYKEEFANIEVNNGAISITYTDSQAYYCASLRTSEKIDLSKYSTLYMTATPSTRLNADYAMLGVTSKAFTTADWDAESVTLSKKVSITASSSEKTFKLDISSVTSSLYVALIFCGIMNITNIWLE